MRTAHSTAVLGEGHVDLDTVRAIVTGVTSIHEIRVAWALTRDPDLKGLRAIERASGLSRESVLAVIPQTGQTSALLHCIDRGVWGWEEAERVPMQVQRVVTSPDHNSFSPSELLNYVQEVGTSTGIDLLEYEDEKIISDRLMSLLNPAQDLWVNRAGQMGDEGWVLAFLTQCRTGRFTLANLATIWRMSERQARRVIARLAETPWAEKTRVDGRVALDVDFTYLLTEEGFNDYSSFDRESRKSETHQYEAESVRLMKTERGRSVREMVRNAKAELAMLRDWAAETGSRAWDELIYVLERSEKRSWWAQHRIHKDLGPVRA